jgi:hypothetical protein
MVEKNLLNFAIKLILVLKLPFLISGDFCESVQKEEALFECPNVNYFDINNELNKPNSTWKLDLTVCLFKNPYFYGLF